MRFGSATQSGEHRGRSSADATIRGCATGVYAAASPSVDVGVRLPLVALSAFAILVCELSTAVAQQPPPSAAPAAAAARSRPTIVNRNTVPVTSDDAAAAEPAVVEGIPGITPDNDPSRDPVIADPDDPDTQTRVPGQRPVRRDGDLTDPEPEQPRDGIVDVGEPPAPVDGLDPTTVDTRALEEARLFENPPPPDDPLLFQIEELQPILDRRPQRLFRFEPFDPVGIRAGSFVLFPELETAGLFNSNVFRSARARSDVALDIRPNARLVSNWNRHALEFRATGTLTYFNEFPSEDDRAYTIETRGRLDLSRRTNVQAALSHNVAQESRSAPDGRAAGTRADVTTDRALVALNHRFNRLSLQLRGSVTEFDFGSTIDRGVVTDNGVRNYRATEQAVRASWEFKPTLSAFSEVEINQRDYTRRDAAGLDRSSDGERYRLGLSFASSGRTGGERGAGPILAGEISAGYGVQRPRSNRLPDVSGVILDSTLTWRPSALTAVAFNARSDFTETQTIGVGGIKSQSVGIDVRHELRRHLIATAGIDTTFADYEGSPLEETETRYTAGLEYFLSREAIAFGRYAHVNFQSNAPGASYDADELRIGLRIRR